MKIKTKISLGLIFLFSVSLLLGSLGSYYLRQLAQEAETILVDNYESLEYARYMLQSLDDMQTTNQGVVRQFEKNLKSQENNITEVGETKVTGSLRAHFEEWKTASARDSLARMMRNDVYALTDLNMQAIIRKNNEAQQTARQISTYLNIIEAVCFLLTFSFIFNFPGYIAGPIQTLTEGIKEIANRNYERRLHFRANDEFGELAQAFNVMAEKLDEYEHSSLAKIIFEKKRIETIINQMQDAVIGLNESKVILFANPVAIGLLGIDEKDLIGKYAPDVATVNDLMRNLIQRMMADNGQTSNGAPLKIFANGRESYFTKDILPVIITRTAETKKMLIGHVIILKNITQFRELDAAKTNFIATISHELKTPISAIKMSVKLLEDARVGSLNEEQQKLIHHIGDDTQRLLKITGELLDLAQVETGNIQLHYQLTDPKEIVEYARQALAFQAEQKKVRIETQLIPDLPQINVDLEKTVWVLINLLSNAIRYTPEGSRVIVEVVPKEKEVEFSVQDFGKGIDPQYQSRIFEKFFRIPNNQDPKTGTGLGLAISKEFITAQNGTISVESQPGEGSRFSFVLPAA